MGKGIEKQMHDNGQLSIILSKKFFEKAAVISAAYKISKICTISIQPSGTNEVEVIFELKSTNNNIDIEEVASNYLNEVIDQQVRLDLDKQTGRIREIIVRHAFEPISNLQDEVENAK